MKVLKILHLADMHLERSFAHLTEDQAALRKSETLINFKNVIDKFNDADVVLIAGDVFDGEFSKSTSDFLSSVFASNRDKYFFVSLGNHDNLSLSGMDNFLCNLPDNVKVFGERIEKIHLEKYGADIYGVSFSADYSYASLINNFAVDNPDRLNVLVVHGDVGCESDYNPMSVSELASTGADYIALGHVHKYTGIEKINGTHYAYSGVFEPGGFDECDECGVIYGTLQKGNAELEFYPVSVRQYKTVNVDISEFLSNEEVIGYINDVVNPDYLYKINLVGKRNFAKAPKEVYERLICCFYKVVEDHCKDNNSVLDYCDEFSLRGKTACELLKHNEVDEAVYKVAHDALTRLMCGD